MYFPYVRGKQFELIALRELCGLLLNFPTKISPVIEPIKGSSTLKSALKTLATKNVNFSVIINPKVGGLVGEGNKIIDLLKEVLQHYNNYQIAIIIDSKIEEQIPALIEGINSLELDYKGITLIHNSEISEVSITEIQNNINVIYNIIYFSNTSRRYYRLFSEESRISLDDYFKDMPRNADYLEVGESPFSEEYSFYKDEGFFGFSDFLTVGDNYSDSGFLPRAVAMHLSYINTSGKIMVKHFVSDSNGDVSDIGGKFAEALEKLVNWCANNNINTQAVEVYKDLHNRGHFPGLGTLKKLSIMNHIELIVDKI